MNKFRKWLIHKLGGYVKSDIPQTTINTINYDLDRVYASYQMTPEQMMVLVDLPQEFLDRIIKKELDDLLKKELIKRLNPTYVRKPDIDPLMGEQYYAFIEIPSIYLKKEEEDVNNV